VTSSHGDHLETEQKYDADGEFALPQLGALPGLSGRRPDPKRYYLSATYFDTEDFDLNQHRVTLRRRVGGTDEGWHLKLPVREDTRQELHAPLDDGNGGVVPARLAAQVADITAGRRLRPIAILDTERTVVTLTGQSGDALVEVADDRVTASRFGPDEKPVTWREIEVEVVSEEPEAARLLEAVGQVLRQAGAKRSSSGSKLSRLLQSLFIADSDGADTLSALTESLGAGSAPSVGILGTESIKRLAWPPARGQTAPDRGPRGPWRRQRASPRMMENNSQAPVQVGGAQAASTAAASARNAGIQRADGTPVRVLVVDDEPSLAELLASVLRYEGWNVLVAGNGADAVRTARGFRPDAVVLDIMLPDFNGIEVMRRLRAEIPQVCVLFLTARDAVEDRVAGITAGGDDYVTKPFSLEEVLARLRGLLRRANLTRVRAEGSLAVGDLTMDEDAREVRRDGELIDLTATEFELLRFLMRNPRRVLSKAQILDRVWNYDFGGQAHVVELYISYLRKKIDAGRVPLIHTVRGVGYVLKPAS
jgi:two-component system OmpR family response regulator